MTLIGINHGPYGMTSPMLRLLSAMFMAMLVLLVSFRHTIHVPHSCLSHVPATHSLIGSVLYTMISLNQWTTDTPTIKPRCSF